MRGTLSVVLLVGLVGCGGKELGSPKDPTTSQQQAAQQMGGSIDTMEGLHKNADGVFSLYSYASSVGALAADKSAKTSSLSQELRLGPSDLGNCVTGNADTGWTYNNCNQSGVGINGSILISGQTTTVDLTVTTSASSSSVKMTLKGTLTDTGTHLSGDLAYELSLNVSGLPGGMGESKTKIVYDIDYTSEPTCITGGFIEVDVSGATSGTARFEWTACNTYKVRNG